MHGRAEGVLEVNYGRQETTCVKGLKEVRDEMGLEAAYLEYEESKVGKLGRRIDGELMRQSDLRVRSVGRF
jgi:hypothetical protein